MAAITFSRGCRQAFAVASIVVAAVSAVLPSPYCNYGAGIAAGLNGASLYLLKEETIPIAAPASEKNTSSR